MTQKLQEATDLQLIVLPCFIDATDRQVKDLVSAAREGLVSAVEEMLQRPQDPDQRTFVLENMVNELSCYQTPLGAACSHGHAEVARLLLFAGASHNCRSHPNRYDPVGATPLYLASKGGHAEVVRVLLEACADKNTASGMDALSPLLVATKNNRTEVAHVLLEGAADANKACGEDTPLVMAIMLDRVDITKLVD